MTYAVDTKVPVERTRMEIERTLQRYGANKFAFSSEPGRAVVIFEARSRRIRFDLPLPKTASPQDQKITRSRWRALGLCIKAKLEAVESQIETFEEAFLAHIVIPGTGKTVSEELIPQLAVTYQGGSLPSLLPPPRST